MGYRAVALGDSWGVDTSWKVTRQMLDDLAELDMHTVCPEAPPGTPVDFLARYVGLGGPEAADLDRAELDLILQHPGNRAGRRYKLVAVQHVEAGSWQADAPTGQQHGRNALADALAAGYASDQPDDPRLTLFCDMESVKDPGPEALGYVEQWNGAVASPGHAPGDYEGFDCGLTPAQLAALGTVLWSDAGPRTPPPGAGFAMKQYAQFEYRTAAYDADHSTVDARGWSVVGLQWVDDAVAPDGGDPAAGQATDPDATIKPG